jgi:hypothetical protein
MSLEMWLIMSQSVALLFLIVGSFGDSNKIKNLEKFMKDKNKNYYSSNDRRDKLIQELTELGDDRQDPEMSHRKADELLLKYINDHEITRAYDSVSKYYI